MRNSAMPETGGILIDEVAGAPIVARSSPGKGARSLAHVSLRLADDPEHRARFSRRALDHGRRFTRARSYAGLFQACAN
jgi:hypothetical protein